MLKKFIFICLAALLACLLLPFCFGLWSEGLSVGVHITMGTPEPTVSAGCQPEAEPEPASLISPDAQTEVGDEEPPVSGEPEEEDAGMPDGAELSPAPESEVAPELEPGGENDAGTDSSGEATDPVEKETPSAESGGGEVAASGAEAAE